MKTLHPGVHGGILARRNLADHMAAIDQHNITPIDVVVVNLYPFRQTVTAAKAPSFDVRGRGTAGLCGLPAGALMGCLQIFAASCHAH